MTKKLHVKIKTIKANAEDVFVKKVIPVGNGATIRFLKRFIGKDVYVIIKRKGKDKDEWNV